MGFKGIDEKEFKKIYSKAIVELSDKQMMRLCAGLILAGIDWGSTDDGEVYWWDVYSKLLEMSKDGA